jgi:glycosyltransferase involved in cell wall biosynthesis
MDSARYIEDNLNSLEIQDFTDFEIIFVDGGSKDDTVALIHKFMRDKTFMYHIVFESSGLCNSMNKGILESRGEFVTFLNSDDMYVNKHSIKNLFESVVKTQSDVIYGRCLILSRGKVVKSYPAVNHSRKLLIFMNFIPHPTTIIRKTLFFKYGLYNSVYQFNFDYEFWIRISQDTRVKFFYLSLPISYFRIHSESISFTKRKSIIKSNLKMRTNFKNSRIYRFCFRILFLRDLIWTRYLEFIELTKVFLLPRK